MEEAKRFLRYVIPGLLFFIEISIYLIISDKIEFYNKVKELGKHIGFPISVLIASGGIGFFFSLIYYTLNRTKIFGKINHLPFIMDCCSMDWLRIMDRKTGSQIEIKSLSRDGAWRIITAYWHESRESSEKIKAANTRADSIADIMHGLGSSFVGSIFAIIVWIYIHLNLNCFCFDLFSLWIPIIISISISILHWINYYQVKKDAFSTVWMIMGDALYDEFIKTNNPKVLYISDIDLSKK